MNSPLKQLSRGARVRISAPDVPRSGQVGTVICAPMHERDALRVMFGDAVTLIYRVDEVRPSEVDREVHA